MICKIEYALNIACQLTLRQASLIKSMKKDINYKCNIPKHHYVLLDDNGQIIDYLRMTESEADVQEKLGIIWHKCSNHSLHAEYLQPQSDNY